MAGFHVTGIDHRPQPRYAGDVFIHADALEYVAAYGQEYDVIHASPPCQAYSEATPRALRARHPQLIAPLRTALEASECPYVIENVEGARWELREPYMLCGTMFGLPLWRHRYFEVHPRSFALLPCCHHTRRPVTLHIGSYTRKTIEPVLISGSTRRTGERRRDYCVEEKRGAMQISWMMLHELDQAIPPVYTEWIGQQLRRMLAAPPQQLRLPGEAPNP